MAYCKKCGQSLAEDARFCTACGHTVGPASPPSQPAPPPAHPAGADPMPPPSETSTPVATASVPGRVSLASWNPALRLGLGALGIGLGIQYVFGIVMVLIQVLTGAGVDWGATIRAPLTVFLSLHGPIEGLGLWASGCGWVIAAFWLAGRSQREGAGETSLRSAIVLAAQSALIYTVPVLVLALLFEPEALPVDLTVGVAGAFFDPVAYGGWAPGLVATLGALTAMVGAIAAVLGTRRIPALTTSLPAVFRSGLVGARSLLAIALPGVALVVIVGAFVEVATGGLGLMLGGAYLLTLLLAAGMWGGLDVGVAFGVFAMRFFIGDEFVLLGTRPAWLFACVAVVALAYLRGGRQAALAHGPGTRSEIALTGAVTGGITAVVLLTGASLATGTAGSLAGPAFGLGLLWSVVAVVGALSVATDSTAPAPPEQQPAPPPSA